MEKSSYQKLRKKLTEIQKWIWIQESKLSDFYPKDEGTRKMLKELQEILNEKGNDKRP